MPASKRSTISSYRSFAAMKLFVSLLEVELGQAEHPTSRIGRVGVLLDEAFVGGDRGVSQLTFFEVRATDQPFVAVTELQELFVVLPPNEPIDLFGELEGADLVAFDGLAPGLDLRVIGVLDGDVSGIDFAGFFLRWLEPEHRRHDRWELTLVEEIVFDRRLGGLCFGVTDELRLSSLEVALRPSLLRQRGGREHGSGDQPGATHVHRGPRRVSKAASRARNLRTFSRARSSRSFPVVSLRYQ